MRHLSYRILATGVVCQAPVRPWEPPFSIPTFIAIQSTLKQISSTRTAQSAVSSAQGRRAKKCETLMWVLRTVGMSNNKWLRLLTYVTGLQSGIAVAERVPGGGKTGILRAHLPAR